MKELRHIKQFLILYKKQYIIGIIALLIVDALQLITPKLIGMVTDEIASGTADKAGVLRYGLYIMGIAVFIAIFRYVWRMKIIGSSRTMEYWIRNRIFSHLEAMSTDFFNYRKTGDLMAHATNDVQAVRQAFGPGIIMLTDSIFITITTIIVMTLTISPSLTLMALIPLPILAALVTFMGTKIQSRYKLVQESFSDMSDRAQESLSGIRVIKSFVQEDKELDRFSVSSQGYVTNNLKLVRIFGFMFPMIGFIASLSFLIAILYGGNLVINSVISLGELVAFITYLGMLTWPMMAIGWVINMIQRGLASLKRINEILDAESEIKDVEIVKKEMTNIKQADRSEKNNSDTKFYKQETNTTVKVSNLENELTNNTNGNILKRRTGGLRGSDIMIRNLSFKYPKANEYALKDINLELVTGKTLAVVGKTGSGKSTLAALLLRFYNITSGEILIGGENIEKIPLRALRDSVGYVPQEAFLFSTTIAENIAFSDPSLSMDKIEAAAKTASVHEDIMEFPKQYQTITGEKGVTLSGGQKQRVAIARALIKDPDILILDDCLSAVDTKTEEAILEHLEQVMKNKTGIIISHRISAIKNADEIIYMEDGSVAERGTHDELVNLDGKYNDLYKKQLLEQQISEEV